MAQSRKDILDTTARRIDQLEARKYQLLQEVNDVDEELCLTRARHRQLLNEGAPISVLPYEILSSIFLQCQTDDSLLAVEMTLACVSSTWRQIALSTANLWTRIHVRLLIRKNYHESVFSRKVELLKMYLQRSREAPLSIRLQATGQYMWSEVLSVCATQFWRCEDFSLSVNYNFSPIEDILERLREIRAQHLRRLSIRIDYSPHHPHGQKQFRSADPTILTLGAPSLTFVRLSGVSGSLQPPLQSVTTLSVDGLHMSALTIEQIRAVLQSAPQLVNLSLSRMEVIRDATTYTSLSLPHLRHLRMYGEDDDDDNTSYVLLSQLPLSQLETLVLREIPHLGNNIFPNVHTLSVTESSFPSAQLVHTVDAFPSLAYLDCDLTTITILLILSWDGADSRTREEDIPAFWPKVEKLCIREMDALHSSLLLKCVQARERRGVPLKALVLDKRSRQVLRSSHQLDELSNIVTLEEYAYESWPLPEPFQDEDDSFWE